MDRYCTKCGNIKLLEEFAKDSRREYGRKSVCKACEKDRTKAWRKAHSVQVKAHDRERYDERRKVTHMKSRERRKEISLDEFHKYQNAASRKSALKYPHKKTARTAVMHAVADAKLAKPDTCGICGKKTTVEAHHADYEKPLDVFWVCRKCHAKLHRETR